ncbi:DNA glycosylase [Chaetomidium leptoderma]|uniref:DNA-(apurinic or apyrimidinic site) lyase n=1 Tax=Chaetomidium leptoderma TaxID=669021 RepID=A0AAN6ZVC6_9PEZI|nr:DNA glycosylase [Chaetomidium leptoderma]
MGAPKLPEWRKLPLSLSELCIDTTLRCGQSFRWRNINDEWHCVLQSRLVSLRQDSSHLHYRVAWPKTSKNSLTPQASMPSVSPSPVLAKSHDAEGDDTGSLLHNYFALSHSASSLYKQWTASDANFARRAPAFMGIRILNQDAWETLVAFICSSNNNISRINQMVQKLCLHYGPYIGTIEGEPFHDFPGPDALSGSQVEGHLRQLGFGYRAKYIADTARMVSSEKPAGWLLQLRNPDCPAFGTDTTIKSEQSDDKSQQQTTYRAAHEALLQLTGVGPKVSDCVCLMGLGWGESVPIDTHVWQIAQRDYNFGKGGKTKTLTKAMYDAVGDHFRKIWGPQAGWAQSVLFTANLKSFAEQASSSVVKKEVGNAEQLTTMENKTAVVATQAVSSDREAAAGIKVEESRELTTTTTTTTVGRTRKRKTTTAMARLSEADAKPVKTTETEVSTRRTSKRIKATAK